MTSADPLPTDEKSVDVVIRVVDEFGWEAEIAVVVRPVVMIVRVVVIIALVPKWEEASTAAAMMRAATSIAAASFVWAFGG